MEVINFAEHPSLVSQYMTELRDVNVQGDMLRFRRNLQRIGEIMAYEISKRLKYKVGIPFHQGFLDYFDHAQNAFVSAYRKYKEKENFDVFIEYIASPRLDGKTLLLVDPMLATGTSMELSYRALLTKGTPAHIHVASVIASKAAVDYVSRTFPADKTTLWVGAVDDTINEHSYIVPGLGDAGDLAYGIKE